MYYYELPFPISLGICGALAGLIGGGFNQCFPIWVGAATGSSIGCAACIFFMVMPEASRPPIHLGDPVVIQNLYITYVSGEPKDPLPVAQQITPSECHIHPSK